MTASRTEINLTKLTPVRVFLRAVKEKYLGHGPGMKPNDRVRRAIEFGAPDRIPHQKYDFWFLFHMPPQSWQPEGDYYPYLHPGMVQTRAWRWEKRKDIKWLADDRVAIDEFGTTWKASGRTSLGEVIKGPLEDGWDRLDSYKLPDCKDWGRYAKSAALSKWLGGDRYRLGVDGNSIWERFRYLRGFENALTDLINQPDEVRALLKLLTDMTVDVVENFKKAGADGFMLVDDWGTQLGPFISPRHFDEFFLPCYKRVSDRCHELGMHCGIHSCGDIRRVVPGLIDSGMDFLELDSPDMCGIDWLSENAAGKTALFLSVNIQSVYPSNDPARIESYIKEMISKLGGDKGGLVAWPYAEPWVIDVGLRSTYLEERTWMRYGKYPLSPA